METNKEPVFQSIGCARCREIVAYIDDSMTLNDKMRLSMLDLICWQCTQRVRHTKKPVTVLSLRPDAPDPRAA
jgi:hypothetical protein